MILRWWKKKLTLQEREPLLEKVEALIEDGAKEITVDLREVEFLNAAGIGTLVQALKLVREKGGRLIVRGLERHLRFLFTVTRTEELFEWEEITAGGVTPLPPPVLSTPDVTEEKRRMRGREKFNEAASPGPAPRMPEVP